MANRTAHAAAPEFNAPDLSAVTAAFTELSAAEPAEVTAPEATAPEATAPAAPAEATEPARSGRSSWAQDMRIYPLVANPKRPGTASHARFKLYYPGITVAEYCAACVALDGKAAKPAHRYLADLRWETDRNFILVLTPEQAAAYEAANAE